MNRQEVSLLFILAIEIVVAVALFAYRAPRPAAPLPDLEQYTDPLAAAEILALHRHGNDTIADWLRLADAYAVIGAYPEAEVCYQRFVGLAPDWPRARYVWALCLERLGKNAKAIEQYEKAIELGYEVPGRCRYRMGRNWLRLEAPDRAEEAFLQCDSSPEARYEVAKIMTRDGRPEKAMLILDELIAENPEFQEPYLLRSRAADVMGDSLQSAVDRERWEWATELQNKDAPVFQARLRVYYGLERELRRVRDPKNNVPPNEVASVLEQYLQYHWRTRVHDQLVNIQLEQGSAEKAQSLIHERIDQDGVTSQTCEALGDAALKLGNQAEALAYWHRAAKLLSRASIHSKLEQEYRQRGENQQADKHKARALFHSGVVAFRSNRLAESEQRLLESLELDRQQADTWFYLGETRRRLGADISHVKEAYRHCLELDAAHGRGHAALKRIEEGLLPTDPLAENAADGKVQ